MGETAGLLHQGNGCSNNRATTDASSDAQYNPRARVPRNRGSCERQQGSCTKEMAAGITAPQPMRLVTLSIIQGQEPRETEEVARDKKALAPRKWQQE